MAWTSAVSDLRARLSDGDTDKYNWRKTVFGAVDGANVRFKTFEFRRVTDFSAVSPTPATGVYVDGTLQVIAPGNDFPESGEFILTTAPNQGQAIEASYYSQWFKTDELTVFLVDAANWCGYSGSFDALPGGLQSAALDYCMSLAYQKLALKFAKYYSEMYRVEDSQSEERDRLVAAYETASEKSFETAEKKRKSYYTRADMNEAPASRSLPGAVRRVEPNR